MIFRAIGRLERDRDPSGERRAVRVGLPFRKTKATWELSLSHLSLTNQIIKGSHNCKGLGPTTP